MSEIATAAGSHLIVAPGAKAGQLQLHVELVEVLHRAVVQMLGGNDGRSMSTARFFSASKHDYAGEAVAEDALQARRR